MKMYEELVKSLRDHTHALDCEFCDRACCYPDGKGKGKCVIIQAADAIDDLNKIVNADNARAYLDRDDLMNTLMGHKKSFDFKDRYGDYGMGFSEAIKVVAMMYPVYMSEPPKEEK